MALVSGTTKVQIISNAFALIGKPRPVLDLSENETTQSASLLYNMILHQELCYQWRFASMIFPLNQFSEAPTNTYYRYAYELPPKYLYMQGIYVNGDKIRWNDFRLYNEFIWTNIDSPLLCEYTQVVSEQFFPAYFVFLMTYAVAAVIAMPNTQNAVLTKSLNDQIVSIRNDARFMDSKMMPNDRLTYNQIESAHYGL